MECGAELNELILMSGRQKSHFLRYSILRLFGALKVKPKTGSGNKLVTNTAVLELM